MSSDQSKARSALQISQVDQRIWNQAIELSSRSKYGEFNLPDPNKVIYLNSVLNSSKELIAAAAVPLIAEAIIVVNEECSIRDRVEAIRLLLNEYKLGMCRPDNLHCFVQDKRFASILKKHFGFSAVKGECLYLEL